MRAVAWILTAAFLVTVPVTGGGRCPCRLAASPRTPTPEPKNLTSSRPAACKCCRLDTGHQTPAQVEDGRPKPAPAPGGPADGPCDHHFVADAAAGPTGERPETAGDVGGTTSPAADEIRTHPPAANASPAATEPPPRSRAQLVRYAHAFRC
jgi:hypothetical protein